MNVLIVDDEPLAREWLARLLARMKDVRVVGEAGSGDEAVARARKLGAEVVLLDIHIPGGDGLQVAGLLRGTPIVFTTAHGNYALDAFELDACDYLVKPISYEILDRALRRARRRLVLREIEQNDSLPPTPAIYDRTTLVVHDRGVARYVDARIVTRLRASEKYTSFRIDDVEYLLRESLDRLEERLGPLGFLRVHRAELVRKDAIVVFEHAPGGATLRLIDGQQLAVSRRYVAATKRILGVA